jgi:hypothetical protein
MQGYWNQGPWSLLALIGEVTGPGHLLGSMRISYMGRWAKSEARALPEAPEPDAEGTLSVGGGFPRERRMRRQAQTLTAGAPRDQPVSGETRLPRGVL